MRCFASVETTQNQFSLSHNLIRAQAHKWLPNIFIWISDNYNDEKTQIEMDTYYWRNDGR